MGVRSRQYCFRRRCRGRPAIGLRLKHTAPVADAVKNVQLTFGCVCDKTFVSSEHNRTGLLQVYPSTKGCYGFCLLGKAFMTKPCQNFARNSCVVVPFPKRDVALHPLSKLAQVEQENAELRRYVADLALQIQNLKSAKE